MIEIKKKWRRTGTKMRKIDKKSKHLHFWAQGKPITKACFILHGKQIKSPNTPSFLGPRKIKKEVDGHRNALHYALEEPWKDVMPEYMVSLGVRHFATRSSLRTCVLYLMDPAKASLPDP